MFESYSEFDYAKKLATAYLHNWQPQSGSIWRPWLKSLGGTSNSIIRLVQIPLSNPSGSWPREWSNQRFTRFFRTWRTEQPLKNSLEVYGLQWSSRRERGSSFLMRQWTMMEPAWQKKMPKNMDFTRLMSRVFKLEGLKCYKRKFTKANSRKSQRPDSRSLVGSSCMIRMAAKPSTTGWCAIFHNITTFERVFWISQRCQGGWKTRLTQRRIADNSGRKKSLREIDQNVVQLSMTKAKTVTYCTTWRKRPNVLLKTFIGRRSSQVRAGNLFPEHTLASWAVRK